MTFIIWAWRDSMGFGSWWSAGNYSFENGAAFVSIKHRVEPTAVIGTPKRNEHRYSDMMLLPPMPPPIFRRGGGDTEYDPEPFDEVAKLTYHEALVAHQQGRSPEDWILMIPHWLIVPAFALLWSFFLILRARRQRRAVHLTNPEA